MSVFLVILKAERLFSLVHRCIFHQFLGLCGFRPLSQIQASLKTVSQLTEAIGKSLVENVLKSTNHPGYLPVIELSTVLQIRDNLLRISFTSLFVRFCTPGSKL